ncbi:MAG: MarR family winged helix-turn-helix transcriptional regulator [Flexilinea sp.]
MEERLKITKGSSLCNCLNMRRASQAITKLYEKYLEPSGLKISQYSLLKTIERLEPVCVSDLADEIRLDRTTLVRNLKPLEEKTMILDISRKGSRNRQWILTEIGKEKLRSAELLWREAQDQIGRSLGEQNLATLTSLLLKIENIGVQI